MKAVKNLQKQTNSNIKTKQKHPRNYWDTLDRKWKIQKKFKDFQRR